MHAPKQLLIAFLLALCCALASPAAYAAETTPATKQDAPKADAAKTDTSKPDPAKPEATKPDTSKPDAPKQDTKPDTGKADAALTENLKTNIALADRYLAHQARPAAKGRTKQKT